MTMPVPDAEAIARRNADELALPPATLIARYGTCAWCGAPMATRMVPADDGGLLMMEMFCTGEDCGLVPR